MAKLKDIEFSNVAYFALSTLSQKDQRRAHELLKFAQRDIHDPRLEDETFYINSQELHAIRFTPQLCLIVEFSKDKIYVLDVLNLELTKVYFPQAAG
jgi:hypothetical protein